MLGADDSIVGLGFGMFQLPPSSACRGSLLLCSLALNELNSSWSLTLPFKGLGIYGRWNSGRVRIRSARASLRELQQDSPVDEEYPTGTCKESLHSTHKCSSGTDTLTFWSSRTQPWGRRRGSDQVLEAPTRIHTSKPSCPLV